ncbi:hypothetical protein GQ457_16G015150 [Hibiscus cannabinus]
MAPSEIPVLTAKEEQILEAQTFANKRVNICLNETNFLLWKQQVILTIRGLGLEGFLDGSISVPSKVSRNRGGEEVINPSYLQFVQQDSSLASWLLSTVSSNILPQLVGSNTTAGIWKTITAKYSSLSTTKVMNLHCILRSMKKGTQFVTEYAMAIKQTCELLASCGSPISDVEHIATILNGLPIEFEPSIVAITASKESYSVDNIVSILVDAETRMEDSSRFPVGINFTNYNGKVVVSKGMEETPLHSSNNADMSDNEQNGQSDSPGEQPANSGEQVSHTPAAEQSGQSINPGDQVLHVPAADSYEMEVPASDATEMDPLVTDSIEESQSSPRSADEETQSMQPMPTQNSSLCEENEQGADSNQEQAMELALSLYILQVLDSIDEEETGAMGGGNGQKSRIAGEKQTQQAYCFFTLRA